MGMQNDIVALKTKVAISYKLSIHFPQDPAIPLKNNKIYIHTYTHT